MAKIKILSPFVLSWEGGYCNDPADLGGPTKYGVTLERFRQVFGKDKGIEDLKKLTVEQYEMILKRYYWDKCKGDEIADQSVANLFVDWCYNAGGNAIKCTQRILGVACDGIVGPLTIRRINERNPISFFVELRKEREDYYKRICKTRPQNKKFLKGWLNRVEAIRYGCLVYGGKKHTF